MFSGGHKEIVGLEYNKNEHAGNTEKIGGVIFDLTCTASNGEQFIGCYTNGLMGVRITRTKQLLSMQREKTAQPDLPDFGYL
ncbi:Rpn family recombination-promoting nuclease/putative transposase [Parapedobacter soli]|uniref:Rpn family recombination-promoting nuclease/putative transposase n=1 Tax=Parapedobacter soli TaxID=416955 RepID=UPI0021C6DE61|nr:Rpn family recombination-promoting nuclease/putative transposase [Parapedobacter soli]